MNTYSIEGNIVRADNEYDAVKEIYKSALEVKMARYIGHNTWIYTARFGKGQATVIVKKYN